MDIADSVIDLIGHTPMVRLVRLTEGIACPVVAKLETTNPGGSVKDRPALAMIDAAEREGLLQPGGTIIEPTSGNTGVGLAIVAAQRGYQCIFVMTDKVSPEKVTLLEAYGAEVVVCPVAVEPDDPASYYSTAERLVRETPGAYRPNQYANPVNPQAHYETTGPEIWRPDRRHRHPLRRRSRHRWHDLGHRSLSQGTESRPCRSSRRIPRGRSTAAAVAGRTSSKASARTSGRPPTTRRWSIGSSPSATPIPSPWPGEPHAKRVCSSADRAARRCRRRSTSPARPGPDDLVVVLIPDSGRGYLSKVFNDDWLAAYGFLTAEGSTVCDILDAREVDIPPLVYVRPDDRVLDAIDVMHKHSVSQLPVAKGDMPLAAAEVQGAVDELFLMERVFVGDDVLARPVHEVMGPKLPTIGVGEPIEMAVTKLDRSPALLVLDGGRPRAVISRSDVLAYLQTRETTLGDVH